MMHARTFTSFFSRSFNESSVQALIALGCACVGQDL